MALIKFLFGIEKTPRKGLLAIEWLIMGYLLLTLMLMLFMTTKIQNPEPMLWLRFHAAMLTLACIQTYTLSVHDIMQDITPADSVVVVVS